MKNFLKKIGNGMGVGLGFVLIIAISFFAVKARSGLSATPGDKLTASKRNEMQTALSGLQAVNTTLQTQLNTLQTTVNNRNRVDVSLSDTTNFDVNCDRRRFRGDHVRHSMDVRIGIIMIGRQEGGTWQRRAVKSTEKGHEYAYLELGTWDTNATPVTKVQKKCPN